jgi:hypothetical protein
MKPCGWDLLLFLLASPILAVRAVIRFVRHLGFLRMTIQTTLKCHTCGAVINLLGRWKCPCGFQGEGHLLRVCPACGSFPAMIRCFSCGCTESVHR